MNAWIGQAILGAVVVGIVWNGMVAGYREPPVAAPSRPPEPFSPGDAAGAAVSYVVTLATLCWLAIMLAVFVAPLGLLVWWLAS